MTLTPYNVLVGAGLMLVQFLLALPWLLLVQFDWAERQKLWQKPFSPQVQQWLLGIVVLCLVGPIVLFQFVQDQGSLENVGRLYGAILQLQVTINLFIAGFALLLLIWPKGGAVTLAAFREAVRQWLFWLLTGLAAFAMFISIVLPYFTFGEDYLMVKQLGYDTIMFIAVLFGTLAASLSITEEIEGRTAITVISKPVSRRQFMLGKFVGILLAALFMFGLLGVFFEGVLLVKHWWEKLETPVAPLPTWAVTMLENSGLAITLRGLLTGIGQWLVHTLDTLPALVLCYSQVMVLVGLAVALATRVPMVVNLTTVLAVFILAHLTPVLVLVARDASNKDPGATVPQLLGFVAGVFDTILPALRLFSVESALISDAPPPPWQFVQYVGMVTIYGIFFTLIALLFGLFLFEDRDLA